MILKFLYFFIESFILFIQLIYFIFAMFVNFLSLFYLLMHLIVNNIFLPKLISQIFDLVDEFLNYRFVLFDLLILQLIFFLTLKNVFIHIVYLVFQVLHFFNIAFVHLWQLSNNILFLFQMNSKLFSFLHEMLMIFVKFIS